MDLELANGEKSFATRGLFRDFKNDREMSAYASVIYMIHAFSGIIPPDYIEMMEKYIFQKFPILGKIKDLGLILELCTPEVKKEISILREHYLALIGTSFTSNQALLFIKERIKDFKPVYEEDLLVENISKTSESNENLNILPEIKNPMDLIDVSPIADLYMKNMISPKVFDECKCFIMNTNGNFV